MALYTTASNHRPLCVYDNVTPSQHGLD